nr:DUF4272 domain-containing protein [Shewanella sairae]
METKESQLSEKRKQRSEIILNKYSVPINNYLPYIEDENEALARNKTDIAMRAMTLLIVAVKAEGLEQEIVESLIKGYRLENSLTPNEKKFLYDPSPSEHDKTQFIWRYDGVFQGSCRLSC